MRALLVVLLAGCSSILGINDVTLVDGGSGTEGAPPNTVIGTFINRCTTPAGTMDAPFDLSTSIVQALLPDGTQTTGYRSVDGSGKADGTFRIDNVPDGIEYLLKIKNTNSATITVQYFVTSAHTIDIHFDGPIRCTPPATPLTAMTTASFNITGMQSYNANADFIEIDSFNVGYQGTSFNTTQSATQYQEAYDWGLNGFQIAGGPIPLLNANAGDDLQVFHMRTDQVKSPIQRVHGFTHILDSAMPTGITLTDGSTVPVNSTFAPVAANKPLQLTVQRSQFDSGYDGTSQNEGVTVTLLAHPVKNDFGTGATLASVDFTDWERGTSLIETLSVNYGDPFPASWTRFVSVGYTRFRFVLFPGTTQPRPVFGFESHLIEYTGGAVVTTPTLPPVGSPKVAGKDFGLGGKIDFDGAAPVHVTWNGVAGAKMYTLLIRRTFADGTRTRDQSVATLTTTSTSIDVPAEVFSGGQFFEFIINAIQAPNDYASGQLIGNGIPSQSAGVPSGMFRMSSKCGDGVVDSQLGEECDTMGETAQCDIDCTLPKCGDGYRNAAAGEACDTIQDTESCNANCTLPRCGDGRINTFAGEDCDDGNTTDDMNGCSANCKFNNICGNGRVEGAAGEQCDPGAVGDTATCDSDCTQPVCGDGHLNLQAGEKCDDGNNIDGDGCSSTCQIE
jgi:cysteine-rich repeat protein